MSVKPLYLAAILMLTLSALPSYAQQGTAVDADDILKDQPVRTVPPQVPTGIDERNRLLEQGLAEAKAELEDEGVLAKKVELAEMMHKIRPTRDQVEAAVSRVASTLPANDRQNFIIAMRATLNYNAIERISIDAMVETYTLKELESMVDYYSKPEAVSASRKIGSWAGQVQPQIRKMLDEAMMRIKTGQ